MSRTSWTPLESFRPSERTTSWSRANAFSTTPGDAGTSRTPRPRWSVGSGRKSPRSIRSPFRDIDMLDPLFTVLSNHRQQSAPEGRYVFPSPEAAPLEVNNLRHRVWYPALAKAGLRKRTRYQTRHTFASLMLSYGGDPLWG